MAPRLFGITRALIATTLTVVMTTGALTAARAPVASADSPAPVTTAPTHLTVGQLATPVDLENLTSPLLGWQLTAGQQTAYQVQVATTSTDLGSADVWDSGKVSSAENANVTYAGRPLSPSSGYYWRVRTWNAADVASVWSSVSHFGTGPGTTWSGASPIWTPGVASGWIDYTYEGTFNIAGVAASVNFRAKDSANFYMWQFRASDAAPDPSTLKIHANVNGGFGVLSINALPFPLLKNTNYDYRIAVDGTNVSTYLKASAGTTWTFVNSTDDASFTAGGIGFRTGNTESAYYDNLKVTDPTGKLLYSNDFADAATTDFTCGSVTGGRLFIGTSRNCNYGVDWQNYTTKVTLNITSNTAAVSLKGTATNNYYLWQLKVGSPGSIVIQKQVSGSFTALRTVTLSKPITAGTDYTLKVVALGNVYKTYVDDTLVDTITDATYSVGRVGFRTGGTEAFTASNLSVTTPDGTLFYGNTFTTGNSDFSCGTIGNGTLMVGNNSNCIVAIPSTNWAFLRGQVTLQTGKDIRWAHLFAAGASTAPARGFVYKMWVNGTYVGIGPTRPIGSETRYDGYDVTSLLRVGAPNAIGVLANTTSDQRFIGKLVVTYTDGTTQSFGTGSGWKALNGSAALPDAGSLGTSYYSAPKENVNAATYPFGFDNPGFDDSAWRTPVVKPAFSSLAATPTAKVERQLRAPVQVTEFSPGNYYVDYGRTWVGGLSLDVTGTAGQVLDIRYGEVTSGTTVRYATSGGNNYQDRWTLKAGRQHLETWGMRVFRYVNVLGAPTGLSADDFSAMAYVYPYDANAGVFDSSDADLNKVYQLNKNTIEATNGNLYVDSWERERGAYEADSYLQMMANFYTSSDPTLGNYSIAYLFKQRTWPTEWPIYIILAMHDSYQQTGDIDALNTYYSALQAKLPDRWYEASSGLIRKTTGSSGAGSCTDCDIVDWPTSERDGYVFTQYNTVINAISYRAYLDMVDIATSLGKTADAAAYQAKADTILAGVNSRMWDSAKGAYRDGLNADGSPVSHWAVQASVFATAFGLADDTRAAAVAGYIGTRGMVCSVYCSAFLFEALYNGDRGDIAYSLLTSTGTRSYLNMINAGAGATMEAWDLSLKPNTTYSHPWAASVAYNLPQGMFGIKPTTAGYDTFDIKPQPDSIAWANVTVPTLKGRIGAAYSTVDGRTDVGVHVPANSTARVYVPGATEGMTSVYLDGRQVTAVYDGGYLRVDTVVPGCHVLSIDPLAGTPDPKLTGICPTGWVPSLAPTITGSARPAANADGWNNTAVDVAFACTDDTGVIGCAGNTTLTNEGADQFVAGDAVDVAGHRSATSYGPVNIDKTRPTLSGAATTDANASGWYTGDVTVTWTGSDALSGVDPAVRPADSVITGEGENLGAGPVTVADRAGNISAPASVTGIRIDRSAPVVTGAPTTSPNAAGWFNEAVTVDFRCTDPLSGVAFCPTSTTINADGADQSVTSGPATDLAGNSSAGRTVSGINLDGTAPATSANNQCSSRNGFCTGSSATVVLNATDQTGLSGVREIHYSVDGAAEVVAAGATATVSVPLDGAGAGTVSYYAVDNAGNTEKPNAVSLKWDNIAPTVTHTLNPTPNASEWNNSDVTVHFEARDDDTGSGVDAASITPDVVVAVETAGREVTGSAQDTVGNTGTDTVTVKLDKTAPAVSGTVTAGIEGADGWYTGPVTVHFDCADALAGVATCTDDVVLTRNGANTVTGTATDKAGNPATVNVSDIRIDTEKPTLTAVNAGGIYILGAVPEATCTATDDISGVRSCAVSVAGGTSNGVGTFTYAATATDRAGNTSISTGSYKVIYRFDGFEQPVDDPRLQPGGSTSIFKAGSTVSARFSLMKADGTPVRANALPVWLTPARGNATTAPVDETVFTGTPDSGSTYKFDGTRYQYNWKTGGGGFYHRIGTTLDDGQTYWVTVGLR